MRDSDFEFIRHLVYARSRINLSPDKRPLVSARLGKRLRATNLASVAEYCRLLQSPGAEEELVNLIDVISTNHTWFFREAAHFDFLREIIVPQVHAASRSTGAPLRIWSAACSSGEEAYSIAITLAETMGAHPWHVEGTDISRRILARAAAGIYPLESIARLPPELLRVHFQRGCGPQEGNFRIKHRLQQHVTFRHLNLLAGDRPFAERFDVIFCRNVMIYFDPPTQAELVQRLTEQLQPGGYLFVGHSESLTPLRHTLQAIQPAIYRKFPAA